MMVTTKSLPAPAGNSFNERKAQFKNHQEQIRLDKLLDHLDFQERVCVKLLRKERQVAELVRKRSLAVRVKSRSRSHVMTTCRRRATTAAGTLPRSVSLPLTSYKCLSATSDASENSLKTVDRSPVLPSTKQTSRINEERQPFGLHEELQHHLLLLPGT